MPSLQPLLTVRAAQMGVFRRARVDPFVEKMVAHARTFFPEQCAALGDEATAQRVRDAVERGIAYGFVTHRCACKIVNIAFELGLAALCDPWAEAILADRSLPPAVRILSLRATHDRRERGRRA